MKVDLLEAGLIPEPGTLQQPRQPAVVALIPLGIDQMGDEFIGGVLGADTALQYPTEGAAASPTAASGSASPGSLGCSSAFLLEVVVVIAANIGVQRQRRLVGRQLLGFDLVQTVGQDVLDCLVRVVAELSARPQARCRRSSPYLRCKLMMPRATLKPFRLIGLN